MCKPYRSQAKRPERILAQYSKKYPNAWKFLEEVYFARGRAGFPDWPPHVFVPMAGAYAVVSGGGLISTPEEGREVAVIAALGAWRLTQSVYRFHSTLYQELVSTKLTGDLPVEVLHRLPEWCVYIETPEPFCHGFWAHLEWDVNTKEEELRLLFHLTDDFLFPVSIHLVGTLTDGLKKAFEYTLKYVDIFSVSEFLTTINKTSEKIEKNVSNLEGYISLILFLCSSEPEFTGKMNPLRPIPKKTKKGLRLFPAPGPRIVKVGEKTGVMLQQISKRQKKESPAERRSPRPHIRRGHWHHYWIGPRKGPRKLILKWIHPLIIGGGIDEKH